MLQFVRRSRLTHLHSVFDSFELDTVLVELDVAVSDFVLGIFVFGFVILEFELDLFELDPKKV